MKNIFQPVPQIHFLLLMFDTISAASPVFYSLTFGPLSDWHKCILLPWNFSVGEDNLQRYTAAEWRIFPLFLFFFFLLMPRLNGNSLGCVLGGCAEHAVVMIDKKERGHRRRHRTPITLPARTSYWKAQGSDCTCILVFEHIFIMLNKVEVKDIKETCALVQQVFLKLQTPVGIWVSATAPTGTKQRWLHRPQAPSFFVSCRRLNVH